MTPRIRDFCDLASNHSLNDPQPSLPCVWLPMNTESCHVPCPCNPDWEAPSPSIHKGSQHSAGPASNASLLHTACCGAKRRHRTWTTSLCFMKLCNWPDWSVASETSKFMPSTKLWGFSATIRQVSVPHRCPPRLGNSDTHVMALMVTGRPRRSDHGPRSVFQLVFRVVSAALFVGSFLFASTRSGECLESVRDCA